MKGHIAVEGHGDIEAAGNLVSRLSKDLGLELVWNRPIRWKNLHQDKGIESVAEYTRRQSDVGALLILRDEDDGCPRERGPESAEVLRRLRLPFPSAIVLLHREYEVLFLPCLPAMAGKQLGSGVAERPGIMAGATFTGDFEGLRGVKEWLSSQFPPGKSYKPTLDQAPLTRLIDFNMLRKGNVPCFGTLERALKFLGTSGTGVYPSAG